MAQGFGDGGAVALALTTGVLTAFNPCGFAMLPAYISYFVGTNREDQRGGVPARIARAAVVGLVVTAGFVTVFGLLGLVATGLRSAVTGAVPYISMVVGVGLVVLAVFMLRGYEPKLSFLKVTKAREGSGLVSMYVYGLSYALVSVSCAFPPFLLNVAAAFREKSVVHSLQLYGAFAAGMALVLLVLTVAVSLAQQQFVRGMRRVGKYVNRVSGVLLLLAGVYVAWYGYYEYRTVVRNDTISGGPVDQAFEITGRLQNWLNGIPTAVLTLLIICVGAGVATAAYLARSAGRKETHS